MTRLDASRFPSAGARATPVARTGTAGRSSATTRAAATTPGCTTSEPLARAAAHALERLRSVPADHPGRHALAVRFYLESVLQQRLGGTAAQDAHWPSLLDAVQTGLQADPALARAAAQLGRALAPD